MDKPILTCAWCLLDAKESVCFAYSIHPIQQDPVDYQRWHFLTSAHHANAHAAKALLGAGPGKEPVTLPNSLWPSVILRLRPRELLAIVCKRLWASQKMGLTLHYLLKQDLNLRCFNHRETAITLWCHILGLVHWIQILLVKSCRCNYVLYTTLNLAVRVVHRVYYINQLSNKLLPALY